MKKNWVLRLGLLAMVLTLVTMPMVSSTYAKYVTSATGSDTARVAKWGVTATVTGGAFATKYTMDDEGEYFTNSVYSSTADKLVAPGTNGTFTGIGISGIPEVAVNIDIVPKVTLSGWTLTNGLFYCPVVFTVNGGTVIYGYSYSSADDLIEAIRDEIEAAEGNYEAGTNLSAITGLNGDITWSWAFETNDGVDTIYTAGTPVTSHFVNTGEATATAATGTFVFGTTYYDTEIDAQNNNGSTGIVNTSTYIQAFTYDQADTYLGKLASAPIITIDIEVTVTQID